MAMPRHTIDYETGANSRGRFTSSELQAVVIVLTLLVIFMLCGWFLVRTLFGGIGAMAG